MIYLFQTNVPDIRLQYRHQTLLAELEMLKKASAMDAASPTRSGGTGTGTPARPAQPANHPGLLPTDDNIAMKAMSSPVVAK
jgi:AMP deaminase